MDRREFVKQVGLGLAAGWAVGRLSWPLPAWAAGPELRLALLADAHLKDGNDRRPEALALARAVAEIRSLSPPPDLVLFAGDLAHRGRPDALDLGREILADLPAPCWPVRGEGDHGPGGNSAWVRRWGEPWFSRAFRGFQLLGLDTSLTPGAGGPVFEIGAAQRQWLARELARPFSCHPPDRLVPRPAGPALSPLAAVDRGRPGSGAPAGPIPPGALPPRPRAWSRDQGSGVRGQV